MSTIARLVQIENSAAADYFLAKFNKRIKNTANIEQHRSPAVQRHHIHREIRLHFRVLEQMIQHNVRNRIAFQFNHNAQTFLGRFITDFRNTLYLFILGQFGDFDNHLRLVNLVRDFIDNNRLVIMEFFNMRFRANNYRTAARSVRLVRAGAPHDNRTRRKVRPRDNSEQFIIRNFPIIQYCQNSITNFAKVICRHICRHTNRNTRTAVYQEIWKLGWQYNRLLQSAVKVRLPIDSVFVHIFH